MCVCVCVTATSQSSRSLHWRQVYAMLTLTLQNQNQTPQQTPHHLGKAWTIMQIISTILTSWTLLFLAIISQSLHLLKRMLACYLISFSNGIIWQLNAQCFRGAECPCDLLPIWQHLNQLQHLEAHNNNPHHHDYYEYNHHHHHHL